MCALNNVINDNYCVKGCMRYKIELYIAIENLNSSKKCTAQYTVASYLPFPSSLL
jgi:hypothetical protein